MEEFMQRVVEEKKDLDGKIERLSDFFNTPIFNSLDEKEQGRLNRQFYAMDLYSYSLCERIEAYNKQ